MCGYQRKLEEPLGSPEAGVTGSRELSNVSAGNVSALNGSAFSSVPLALYLYQVPCCPVRLGLTVARVV